MTMYPVFQKTISLIIITAGFLLMHYGGLPMLVAPVIIIAGIYMFLLFSSNENFNALLFSFKRFEFKAVWMGAIAAVSFALFIQFLWDPFMGIILPGEAIDLSAFDFIKGNEYNYAFMLLMSLLLGGFFEELFFHGFTFTSLEKIFKGKYAMVFSLILSNIIFSLYHYQMGIKEVLLAMIAGIAYHLLILRFNRNLWYGIFFHTFFDWIGLTQIYMGNK